MDIKLFGITKEIIGKQELTVPVNENIKTVGSLRLWLADQYPAIKNLSSLAIAVNNEYAEDDKLLHPQHEIALIPPVSGG